MFEDLIANLEEMGVTYTEDYEAGILTIDIADVDKLVLIDIINELNAGGYAFDIDETAITVSGGATETTEETYDEEAYLDDALTQA